MPTVVVGSAGLKRVRVLTGCVLVCIALLHFVTFEWEKGVTGDDEQGAADRVRLDAADNARGTSTSSDLDGGVVLGPDGMPLETEQGWEDGPSGGAGAGARVGVGVGSGDRAGSGSGSGDGAEAEAGAADGSIGASNASRVRQGSCIVVIFLLALFH
jgi:hypothetical protein